MKKASIKYIQARLEESEVRYRRLFESAYDGILILDSETGQITDVNPFLENLLGYTKAEFLDKKNYGNSGLLKIQKQFGMHLKFYKKMATYGMKIYRWKQKMAILSMWSL